MATRNQQYEAVIIGTGFAGLCAAIQLRKHNIENFVLLEKDNEIGGTWRDNTYPGCACDVRAMLYSFSFELNTKWSREYPQQEEILAYLKHCAHKYGIYGKTRFNQEVSRADYDEESGLWQVQTREGEEFTARFLLTGTGQLNRPNIPDIPGKDTFEGESFHSARWNHSFNYHGRRVAMIGNGASALQIAPELATHVQRLDIYQRDANWIIPRGDRAYSWLEKWAFSNIPMAAEAYRTRIYLQNEMHWPILLASPDGILRKVFEELVMGIMRSKVSDEEKRRKLTPSYPAGCKRVLISDDYYPTVARSNVELVDSPIYEITPRGILTTDGKEREVDAIVFATGFKSTELLSPIEIYGRGGLSINEAWQDGPEAYLGVSVYKFPNMFMMYGPNTNLGHNSIVFMIENQVNHIVKCIQRVREEKLKSIEVSGIAMRSYNREAQQALAGTVWAGDCQSWYKNKSGKITNNWFDTTLMYWWRMQEVNFSDYIETPLLQPLPRKVAAGA